MQNIVLLTGRLGRDPELKSFQSGGSICNVSVATSESWKDRQSGEWKDRTEWHNVVIQSEALAKAIANNWKKGDIVNIVGSIRSRKWQDRDGNDRYTTEIIVSNFGGQARRITKGGEGGGSGGGGNRSSGGGSGGGGWNTGGSSQNSSGGWGGGGSSWGGGDQGGGQGGDRPPFDSDLDDDVPF